MNRNSGTNVLKGGVDAGMSARHDSDRNVVQLHWLQRPGTHRTRIMGTGQRTKMILR